MYGHDIRWFVLVPVAILIGLASVVGEVLGIWGGFPARPDWLWCLAFFAALKAPPAASVAAFFLCGVLRDVILGPRLGSAALAYTLIGWLSLAWRVLATARGWPSQALVAGWAAFLAALVRHSLDYGPLAYTLLYRIVFTSFADGILTMLAYMPLAALLSTDSFRPRRERDWY